MEDWLHDCAVVTSRPGSTQAVAGRHYILIAMTKTPKGDDYLEALAPAVDDVMSKK